MYDSSVKSIRIKYVFILLASLVATTSCSNVETYPQGYIINYDDYRSGLHSLKPFIKTGENFNWQATVVFLDDPWWGCVEEIKNIENFQKKKGNNSIFESTLKMEQIGYCLPQIDMIVSGYINSKVWTGEISDSEQFDLRTREWVNAIKPSSKASLEFVCMQIIQDNLNVLNEIYEISNLDKNQILKGCIIRFEDTLATRIARAKFNFESFKLAEKQKIDAENFNREAQKQADLEAQKQADLEAQKQAYLEENSNPKSSSFGKWVRKCKNVTSTTTGDRLEIIDGRIQGGPVTTITKVCEDVWVP